MGECETPGCETARWKRVYVACRRGQMRRGLFVLLVAAVFLFVAWSCHVTITHLSHESSTTINGSPGEHRHWVHRRQELHVASNLTKVIMFAYTRSGSSFGGEMFNQDPAALLWYEPLDQFYSAHYGTGLYTPDYRLLYGSNFIQRTLGDTEQRLMLSYFKALFECRLDHLPTETLLHPFMFDSKAMDDLTQCVWENNRTVSKVNYRNCKNMLGNLCNESRESAIRNHCFQYIHNSPGGAVGKDAALTQVFTRHRQCLDALWKDHLTPCMSHAHRACNNRNTRVLEILRMHMSELGKVIESNPDVYVIYYTRDPRAISHSRVENKTRFMTWTGRANNPVQESRYVCANMRSDIAAFEALKDRYPGALVHVRYEDLVRDPIGTSRHIYKFLHKAPPSTWESYAKKTMFGNPKSIREEHQSTRYVNNATQIAYRWRLLANQVVKDMTANCEDVLQKLGYTL